MTEEERNMWIEICKIPAKRELIEAWLTLKELEEEGLPDSCTKQREGEDNET